MSNFGIKIDCLKLKGAFMKNLQGKARQDKYETLFDYPRR